MKKRMMFGFLGLAFIVGLGVADDLAPVAVSPGLPDKTAVVRESCPTFSWTAVSWALTYEVVVFEAVGEEVPTYENMAANASPVLIKEIPGKALSWTPSADEALLNGGSYVWYVEAMANTAQGSWSVGRKFMVAESSAWGVVSEPREDRTGTVQARMESQDKDLELTEEAKKNFDLTGDSRSDVQFFEGYTNTAFGRYAGLNYGAGSYNTFMGFYTGPFNQNGQNNTFIGSYAGFAITTGSNNAFLGYLAGRNNAAANDNTFLGTESGQFNTTGYGNTFAGRASGRMNQSGHDNAFIGYQAGNKNTTGYNNTFVGPSAGVTNTTGYNNTFLGYGAGYATTKGRNNTFLGYGAGYKNTSASGNAFLGHYAGYGNTTGYYNTFVGPSAGTSNTTGYENTFVGLCAGRYNLTGFQNTFVGNEAGYNNTAGVRNVFLGYNAGNDETGSDKLYIANDGGPAPLIWGDFASALLSFNGKVGIYTTPTSHKLEISGGAHCDGGAWVDGSSREYKENIEDLTTAEAQQAFEKLEPVKFNYKKEKGETYLGFIAEDVPDLVAMNDRKGLNPMDMVAVLTKVVQEQMKVNQEQQKAISELKEKITKLEKQSREE